MIRKILVAVISLVYMIFGFLNFYNSLTSALFSSGLFTIKIFPLISGILAFYAGLSMFRLNEFGRKLVVILLTARVFINIMSILQFPLGDTWLGIENRFGEIIHKFESPYAFQIFLLAWITVALLIIIFLSQKETKDIFAPQEIKDVEEPGIIFE